MEIMKKYKAVATLQDNEGNMWDVTIYTLYNSIDEALEGVSNFVKKGYNILKIAIE